MKIATSFCSVLFCSVLFCSVLFCSVVHANENSGAEIVVHDDCNLLVKHSPWKGAHDFLIQKKVSQSHIDSVKVPRSWLIKWHTFTSGTFLGGKEKFTISAPENMPMVLYGPSLTPHDSRFYSIELTVRMPQKSKFSKSTLKLGHHKYGFYLPAEQWSTTETVAPGECKTFKTAVDLSQDFSHFVPMISISGEVEFENLTVKKLPDDLVKAGLTVVEGTLTELSAIPDPKKSDYPDCRFVCRFYGNSILSGNQCPREFAAVLEGFTKYKYRDTKNLKSGDKVRMLVIPFNKLPDEKKSTQQADDLDLFMLENYYVIGLSKVWDFRDTLSGIIFSGEEYISIFEHKINPPLPEKLKKVQQEVIVSDLKKIKKMLSSYDKNKISEFNSWLQKQAKNKNGKNRIADKIWYKVDDSFWCLPLWYNPPRKGEKLSARNIDAIVEFKDFLEANGCQFIIALTPFIYDISARVINKDFRDVPDFRSAVVARQLLERGVETIYYSDELIKNYNRYPWAFFFPGNAHPSDTTQDVLADILAARLKRFNFSKTLDPKKFSFVQHGHVYGNHKNYLWPENCDIGSNTAGTSYQCRRVLYDGKDIKYDPEAPVLILGNSFIQTPMAYPESLPTLLMSKILNNVSVLRVDGYGPLTKIIPAIGRNPQHYLKGKQVVIMVLGIVHFPSNLNVTNLREFDAKQKMLTGKKVVVQFSVKSNTKEKSPGNWIRIGKSEKLQLLTLSSPQWDTDKEFSVLLPTKHDNVAYYARYKINNVDVHIPHSTDHNFVIHKLPAGTKHLTVELQTHPNAVLSIQNISIYQ